MAEASAYRFYECVMAQVTARDVSMGGNWVTALGGKHGARERAATLAARTASDGAAETAKLSVERWMHIVAAMTQLVGAYNVAFARDVLAIAEDRSDPNRPAVSIVRIGGTDAPSLLATLEGSLICVHSRDAQGLSCDTECPLVPGRDDDRTAAYVLQHWMEHL